jgi:hypothetical protein
MQYLIKLLPKEPPRFAEYWTGSDWTKDIDEAHHYNRRSEAEAEVRSLGQDEMYDRDTQDVSIDERS